MPSACHLNLQIRRKNTVPASDCKTGKKSSGNLHFLRRLPLFFSLNLVVHKTFRLFVKQILLYFLKSFDLQIKNPIFENSNITCYGESGGEVILYQPDNEVKLEVRLEDETVWLTQAQLVELFQSSKANISEHIKNIYEQEELEASSTVRDFRTVRQEGGRQVARIITYYNLDAIISIGFALIPKGVFNSANGLTRC